MMELLRWVEGTGLAAWVRESVSLWAYPGMLSFHTIGLAFAVGVSVLIDLRVLGFAPSLPLAPLRSFVPVMWIGFWVNAVSGVFLLIAYASTLLTNPIFLIKLALIAVGLANALWFHIGPYRQLHAGGGWESLRAPPPVARLCAMLSLLTWTLVICAGRLIAYV